MRAIRGKQVSLIQQEPMTSLNPVLSIGDQIGEVIRHHDKLSRRAARARGIELLDLVSIPDAHRRIDDYPHNLSGGMRQRVMIAMAVACGPKLLIADEPTTALDVTTQAQVLDLLDDLRRQLSMAVLLITHDLGVVAQWADRIAVMYAGRIVEQAGIEPFFARPMHPYSRGLLGARVDVDADEHYSANRLSEIPGSVGSAAGEAGCAFAPRCPLVEPACRQAPPPLLSPARPSGAWLARSTARGGLAGRHGAALRARPAHALCRRQAGAAGGRRRLLRGRAAAKRSGWWANRVAARARSARPSCAWCRRPRARSCSTAPTSRAWAIRPWRRIAAACR